jgi:hypothetical protein
MRPELIIAKKIQQKKQNTKKNQTKTKQKNPQNIVYYEGIKTRKKVTLRFHM